MGEILYRRQLIQINICFVLTLTRSCVSFCIFTMADSSVSTVAGPQPAKAIRDLPVQSTHPEFPIVCTTHGRMPALADGANANLWGADELMSVSVFNVNYSQTRTSLCMVALPTITTACMPVTAQLCIIGRS